MGSQPRLRIEPLWTNFIGSFRATILAARDPLEGRLSGDLPHAPVIPQDQTQHQTSPGEQQPEEIWAQDHKQASG